MTEHLGGDSYFHERRVSNTGSDVCSEWRKVSDR